MRTQDAKRKPRADKGPRVVDRDKTALIWIAQQYAIRQDHLAILLARLSPKGYAPVPKQAGRLTENRTLEIVRRWETLGFIERGWILDGEPPWIWPSPEGLRLITKEVGELRHYKPTASKIEHLYWINHTRLFIEGRRQDILWTSERVLHQSEHKRVHLPDAHAISNERLVAIEVELTVKSGARLTKILNQFALDPEYATIWYFTRGRSTAVLTSATEAMNEPYKSKFVIYDLDMLSFP